MLKEIVISEFRNSAGTVRDIKLTYRLYGPPLVTAPVVLINHALTGNSHVSGESGWWKELVGFNKVIDTELFSVLAIDIPGNGASEKEEDTIANHEDFTLHDMARLQAILLTNLKITEVFAAIGGSIGGALAWELAALQPELIRNLIPIACDYKSTDWVLAQCEVQKQILNNSLKPVHDARMHAMTFYRTPQSFEKKFKRQKNSENGFFEVSNWLHHHGKKLEERFRLSSYKLMNHLLTTIDISQGGGNHTEVAAAIDSMIHIVAVNSDLLFLAEENKKDFQGLKRLRKQVAYHEIKSVHGHDAFLIAYDELIPILAPIFRYKGNQS